MEMGEFLKLVEQTLLQEKKSAADKLNTIREYGKECGMDSNEIEETIKRTMAEHKDFEEALSHIRVLFNQYKENAGSPEGKPQFKSKEEELKSKHNISVVNSAGSVVISNGKDKRNMSPEEYKKRSVDEISAMFQGSGEEKQAEDKPAEEREDSTQVSISHPRVQSWIKGAQHIVNKEYEFKSPPVLRPMDAGRYIKILRFDREKTGSLADKGRTYIFIDKTNGDIVKPTSEDTPSGHTNGNVHDADNGLRKIANVEINIGK
jgi:hypothetical protein